MKTNTKIYNHIGKLPNIHCKSDLRDIRIYINDIFHICIPRCNHSVEDSIWVQSWLYGNKVQSYWIEVKHEKGDDYYVYDNREIWKKILQLLDENI